LIYLVCHPAGRTREQIGRALWPKASAIHIKIHLHLTLHQLRRTLGRPDWIVFEERRYRVNPGFPVDFDGVQFEALVRGAQATLAKTGDRGPLARALERYKGDFLAEAGPGEWHVELRDRWKRLYDEGRRALA
jgi:two-component SAPR family response regulator